MSSDSEIDVSWSRPKLVGFRFVFLYWVATFGLFPLGFLPLVGDSWSMAEYEVRFGFGAWIGTAILGRTDIPTVFTGSGDGLASWIHMFSVMTLSLMAAALWTGASSRTAHPRLARWFEELVALWLGATLISYGLAKAIPNQMPFPGLNRLLLPYGEASPMGVVWRMMGTSPAYSMAAGWAELIPGLLLFFHRTRTAGALLGAFVMANVVLLNFCFDVPVKQFSLQLLVALVALLAVDRRRLVGALISTRPIPRCNRAPLMESAVWRRRWLWGRLGFLLLVIGVVVGQGVERYFKTGNGREKPPLWGVHEVVEFKRNGVVAPPLTTDQTRWSALVIDNPMPLEFRDTEYPGSMTIVHMDGTQEWVPVEFDPQKLVVRFLARSDDAEPGAAPVPRGEMSFQRTGVDQLVLRGRFDEADLDIRFETRDLEETMLLLGRGFHWVNDYPLNR